jgi:glycosyltransferase involved in cell wall biosynthesis
MGKKLKAKPKKSTSYPFVSICTPTFNRRPFIPMMLKCFNNQDYPKSRLEWIIIDDGTDKIEDLIIEANIPQIKYFKYDEKMTLGKKRNLMHEKSSGTHIVYMDDDDYYPSDRITHAIETLQKNPKAMCAGSSAIHVYFKHLDKIIRFGPYGDNHATAATFAFKRKLLDTTKYDDDACLAEEKKFLKDYTVPFVQLDPIKSILVFSHEHNSFDKRHLLKNPNPKVVNETELTVKDFIQEEDLRDFFLNKIDDLITDYEPGDPKHKPDVINQMKVIQKRRDKILNEEAQKQGSIVVNREGELPQILSNQEVLELLTSKDNQLKQLIEVITIKENEMIVKDKEIAVKDKKIKSLTIETEKGDRLFVQLNELLKLQKDKISVLTKLNKSNDVV